MALPGDQVTVICKDTKYSGILMPRPEMLSDDVVVLKLSHGYNMGISKDRIKEIVVKKPYTTPKKVQKKLPVNSKLPTVALISCGGTIASRVDYRSGGVYADYDAHDFVSMVPELADYANIVCVHSTQLMSEDIVPEDWMDIGQNIKQALNAGAEGVVVTHGTDTMHYTAAILSFLLKDVTKPVVLTGSQRSIDRPSSDAFMNLTCAVIAAGSKKFSGVVTCMHGTSDDQYCLLISGTHVRKMHTSRRDAFRSLNEQVLGRVFSSGKLQLRKTVPEFSDTKTAIDGGFEEKTGLVTIHPGISPAVIEHYLAMRYRGLVISATAFGHVPTGKNSLIPVLKEAVDQGLVLVISSQTLYGRVNPHVYTNLRKLSMEVGALYVEDMHPETAYMKLGWALSKEKDTESVKKLLLTDISGEMTHRSVPFTQFLS